MQQAGPDRYQPPLRFRDHLWRVLLSLAFSAVVWLAIEPAEWHQARWLFWTDLGLGAVALALSFYRRRHPLAVALLVSACGAVSSLSAGLGLLVAVSLATRRVLWQIVLVGATALLAA